MVERVWGPLGLQRTEVRKLAAAPDGSPPYQIIWSGYFPSVQALEAVLQNAASGEVVGDIPNCYQARPTSSSEGCSGKPKGSGA
jgi:hypothetical protein